MSSSDIHGRGDPIHTCSGRRAVAAPQPINMPAVTDFPTDISAEHASIRKLRLVCFNMCGLQCNNLYTQILLQDADIIALSEHWLHNYNFKSICYLHSNFKFHAMSPPEIEDTIYCIPHLVRGHGGVAIGWRADLDILISIMPNIHSPRMVGIKLECCDGPLFIIAVYLPSRAGCTDSFKECMDHLGAVIELLPPGCKVIVMGDFNADLGALGGPMSCSTTNEQGSIFFSYLNAWDFISSHLHLSHSRFTHTYESEAHSSFSTIDYIICLKYLLSSFHSSKVLDDHPLNTSDHLPVAAELLMSFAAGTLPTTQTIRQSSPN